MDESQIEELVRSRATIKARKAITSYLKRNSRDEDALIQACEWYRRLGLFREGFRLLNVKRLPVYGETASTQTRMGRRIFWVARLLNNLGAHEFAEALLNRVTPTLAKEFRQAGSIYLTNFRSDRALECFKKAVKLDKSPDSYDSRLGQIGLADAQAYQGDPDTAIETAKNVLRRSPESLLRGICCQVIGEYHSLAGRHRRAVPWIRKSLKLFPEGEQSVDRAFALKWLGVSLAKSDRKQEGLALLDESLRLLRQSSQREETWLEVYRRKLELNALNERERSLLFNYPGLLPGFRKDLPPGHLAEPALPPSAAVKWLISLPADEWAREGRYRLRMPSEIRLLAYLALAGEWGISRIRLLSLLWPDEPHSFIALEGRLNQLLYELKKKQGVEAGSVDGLLRLSPQDLRQIHVIASGDERPTFLTRPGARFEGTELDEQYGISRSQRFVFLADWLKKGWIERVPGAGYAIK